MVKSIAFFGFCVAKSWGFIKKIYFVRSMFYAFAQHVDYSALCDLSLKAGKKLLPVWAGVFKVK